jgi:CheY-like chemotaxis protein
VLVVEDDKHTNDSLVERLNREGFKARGVAAAGEAMQLLERERYACMVLDLSLPDMDGLELLARVREKRGADVPSVLVYTARALSKDEVRRLEAYTEAVVMKDGASLQRVVEEIQLFVKRVKDTLSRPAAPPVLPEVALAGKKLLVVDDDMRTVYALSATLKAKGAAVVVADTGKAALETLERVSDVDAVLMDIMMPEMDGYEAMRRLRRIERFKKLPVIALTAKAMKGDGERCIEAGASAYLPKPVESDRLLKLLQTYFPKAA